MRGQHPDVSPDQYGATAHRVGLRLKAAAHAVHYGMGVPVRKVPAILKEFTGLEVTQSALTQDALKKASGVIGNVYQELRASVASAPVVYTDDTSWPIHGQAAHLMAFDTDQATVFQIRKQHRNEEVREVIPADYAGVMVTDRGKSYEADELSEVDQQKCLDHLNNNIDEVLETKTGPARSFGLKLKRKLKDARQLWREQRAGQAEDDGFNRLTLTARLAWREVAMLRAYAKYLRQTGFTFSQAYLEATLAMKEQALAKTTPHNGRAARYQPGDQLLGFLNSL